MSRFLSFVYFVKALHFKIREILHLGHVASFAFVSLSAKLRLCPLRYQNAFASDARRCENVRVCPALIVSLFVVSLLYTTHSDPIGSLPADYTSDPTYRHSVCQLLTQKETTSEGGVSGWCPNTSSFPQLFKMSL